MPPAARGRFFPQPFRVDARAASVFSLDGDDARSSSSRHQQHPSSSTNTTASGSSNNNNNNNNGSGGSSSSSGGRPPLFSSELPPPSASARFNKDGSENVEWARYQSTLRLKAKWDSIYERYKDAHLVEQDEIEMVPRRGPVGGGEAAAAPGRERGKSGAGKGAGRKRKRKRVPFGKFESDFDSDSEFEVDFGALGGGVSSPSSSSYSSDDAGGGLPRSARRRRGRRGSDGIRVVRDCGVLRNLAGTLHFGSFIKDEELDALEAVLGEEEQQQDPSSSSASSAVKTEGSSSSPVSGPAHRSSKAQQADGADADSAQSEVELSGDDDDEIGGWGEKAFLLPQYPEFDQDPRPPPSDSSLGPDGGGGDDAFFQGQEEAAAERARRRRGHDPDLEEFLLAEERRRRIRAINALGSTDDEDEDDDEDDEDVIDLSRDVPRVGAEDALASGGRQIMDDIEAYYSSDDNLDTLGTPGRRKQGGAGSSRGVARSKPPAGASGRLHQRRASSPSLPLSSYEEFAVVNVVRAQQAPAPPPPPAPAPASFSHAKEAPKPAPPSYIIPSFEDAQRARRAAVEAILGAWTREQEDFLARAEEEERYRFDVGFRGGVPLLPLPPMDVVVDVFESLPASYRGIAGLGEMLAESSGLV